MERLLAIISSLLGLISFFWLAVRNELPNYTKKAKSEKAKKKKLLIFCEFSLPYVAGIVCVTGFLIIYLMSEPKIHFHRFRHIHTNIEKINLRGRSEVEIFSSEKHFKIRVQGEFYGPQLSQLLDGYSTNPKERRVYGVVIETRPESKDLWFVQSNEYGLIKSDGQYDLHAYLGGIGEAAAKDNERFYLRIYVPKNPKVVFKPRGSYLQNTIPDSRYISEPISIITKIKHNK